MKRIILIVCIICLSKNYVLSQTDSLYEGNLYIRSISILADSSIRLSSSDILYFKLDEGIIIQLPDSIKGKRILYLSQDELKSIVDERDTNITVLGFNPMKNENDLLRVSFLYYKFGYTRFLKLGQKKYSKKTLYNAIEGGFSVYYKFDCYNNDFVVVKTHKWGID